LHRPDAKPSQRVRAAGRFNNWSLNHEPEHVEGASGLGEDSRRQFKRDVTNAASLAAFANSEGGVIYSNRSGGLHCVSHCVNLRFLY
jgi:predicted Ser/Thr protein kinase